MRETVNKRDDKVVAAIQRDLRPGETVEVVTDALKGVVGPGGAIWLGRRCGVVLTDQRLLLAGANPRTGRFTGVDDERPRSGVRATSAPRGCCSRPSPSSTTAAGGWRS
jgi:hypothetical protein